MRYRTSTLLAEIDCAQCGQQGGAVDVVRRWRPPGAAATGRLSARDAALGRLRGAATVRRDAGRVARQLHVLQHVGSESHAAGASRLMSGVVRYVHTYLILCYVNELRMYVSLLCSGSTVYTDMNFQLYKHAYLKLIPFCRCRP